MSEPLKAVLRRLTVRPPVLPIVSNVTGNFYPADADVDTMLGHGHGHGHWGGGGDWGGGPS